MYKLIGADGKEYGPVSAAGLQEWIAQGRANGQTKVLPEGATEWRPLSQLPEFAAALARAATPVAAPVPISAPAPPRTNPLALTGLILGALSLTCGLCCYGLPFNLAGIICSGLALAQIKRDASAQQGRGLALAGLVLSLLSILLAIALLLFNFTFGGSEFMRRIQRL